VLFGFELSLASQKAECFKQPALDRARRGFLRGVVMEKFWRAAGVQLGKQWKIVIAAVVVITAVLALGAR